MSKSAQDELIAGLRSTQTKMDKPWFKSASDCILKHNLRELNALDLCAGNGEFSIIMRDRFSSNVTCADYAPTHLRHLSELGFSVINVDFDDDHCSEIAVEHESEFDFVVSLATIEHIFDTDAFLNFCHKVLKPDGKLILNTPNISFIGYRLYSLFSGNLPVGEGHHVRFFNFRNLRTMAYLNGFSLIEDLRAFYTTPIYQIRRAIPNWPGLAWAMYKAIPLCRTLVKFPLFRNISADVLTLLLQREESAPMGSDIHSIQSFMENCGNPDQRELGMVRLRNVLQWGWIDEHPNLKKWVQSI